MQTTKQSNNTKTKNNKRHRREPTVEEEVLAGLAEFTEALEHDELSERMTCRQISLEFEVNEYNPQLVKRTRKLLGISQVLFARFLGVAPNTVRSWEQGASMPSPIARRFMDEIRESPTHWRQRLKAETKFNDV